MSLFISKALRRAEVFLEQVDESVAQASRRLVVNDAIGDVDEHEDEIDEEDDTSKNRASAILSAEQRARGSFPSLPSASSGLLNEGSDLREEDQSAQISEQKQTFDLTADLALNKTIEDDADAWGDDFEIDESAIENTPIRKDDTQGENAQDFVETKVGPEDQKDDSVPSPNSIPKQTDEISSQIAIDSVSEEIFQPPQKSEELQPSATSDAKPQSTLSSNSGAMLTSVQTNEYIAALKEENAELRKELEQLDDDFDKTRKEKGRLVKNLKRMKEIVNEMDESLREKSTEARGLESDLMTAKDEIQSLLTKSREEDARSKDGMDNLRKELTTEIETLQQQLNNTTNECDSLKEENERLNEALQQGHEVDLATADGARRDASQAHKAYEAETQAHRETRTRAKEREEELQAEAALATSALAVAQRKTEESMQAASEAKSIQRMAESKLATVTSARDAAFARIEDLQEALRMYEHRDGLDAPGQKEAKEMQQTISELENALETKNVELARLEGELQAIRSSGRSRRDVLSSRSGPHVNRSESQGTEEVEIKLRHMADAALRKQAQLEVLRSENRALQHQLGMERKRTREAQAMAAAASSSRQSIRGGGFRGILDTGEDDRGDRSYGVRDGPLARFRAPRNWPRVIAKSFGGLDRFSAQALAFLRREPLLRIVILIYLIAIHIFIYSLLHWHVDVVTGSLDSPHASIASMKSGKHLSTK